MKTSPREVRESITLNPAFQSAREITSTAHKDSVML